MRYLQLCLGGVEMHDAFKKTVNADDEHSENIGNRSAENFSAKQAYFMEYQETIYAQQEVENYIAIMIIVLIVCFCFYVIKVI